MNFKLVIRILGVLLMIFSATMLPPIVFSIFYDDGQVAAFFNALLVYLVLGAILWYPLRHLRAELRLRDGFLVVSTFWVVIGLAGALPFLFSDLQLSLTDAFFEAVSGLTTTGATILVGLDEMPRSVLYYRHQLQWLGGMGIIVLALAILPMLGVGGMQLYRAETPGPVKDSKLTPRITETAKALWYIYLGLTVLCMLAYFFAGMTWFDALCHSFSTIAIGGFSTHDASIGHFNSPLIDTVAIIFMLIAGMNFALHFTAYRRWRIKHYFRDAEFRTYLFIIFIGVVIVALSLEISDHIDDASQATHAAIFQVVSIATTTGFTTANYSLWPGALPLLLILLSFIGGCAGSTAGGMKVIRWLLVFKQGMREVVRLVHPSAEIPVKLANRAVSPRVIDAVWGFFSVYIVVFGVMMLLMMATGLDQVTAFSAVAASLNNLGPGLGEVAGNFVSVNDTAKWISIFAMLLGRLEIFTLLVLFTTAFWEY
ncbi:MAG: potassium transporter [Gammaproteobacteria bacterium]|nr:TrkH family potassium uptake protein [Gammaproteobacteria bacterium]NNC98265.1 potassium transporter [Gammaproteobacteria bacterium]NNM14912.1 potassium transporter [Gammaproteobacteria bacterium]